MKDYNAIMQKFYVEGEVTSVIPLGHGKVNHTFEVVCGGQHYVLQEINHIVFKFPAEVMNNLFLVTEYLRGQIEAEGGDPSKETLTYIRTRRDNPVLQTETGSYYRLYRMVEEGEEMPKPQTPEEALEAGAAIGIFQHRLAGFPVSQLSYSFPQMHRMRDCLRHLVDAVRADICLRTFDCQEQIHFVLDRSEKLYFLEDAMKAGQIPRRVTHNDAGYSNVLIDPQTKKAICMIDLDTVMPGCSLYDFGEAARTGAATVPETDKSGDVELDLELYRALAQGYIDHMGHHLTEAERMYMNDAVWLAAMERGMNYLTNYLSGDRNMTDFSDEQQNLYCAVNQFFLVLDIEEKKERMDAVLKEIYMSAE